MPSRLSVKHIPVIRKRRPFLARIVIIFSLPAIILIAAAIMSFSSANQLMREPPRPLQTISSNVMPPHQLASFTSLNEQSMLSGWFFQSQGPAVSTIILVHDQGENRFPLGIDSPPLFEYLTEKGFNVLAFDLRNAGRSDGDLSGYGYAEWEDVLAAIRYVRRVASTRDVLLYGFGTGVTATLAAYDQLPRSGQEDIDGFPRLIRELGFDQGYIRGLLLDTPASSADDYIRPELQDEGFLGRYLLQHSVPYAIRLSTGGIQRPNLVAIISRVQVPVFVASSERDSRIPYEQMQTFIDERQRLHPDTTVVFKTNASGTVRSYIEDQEGYEAALSQYFARYFQAR